MVEYALTWYCNRCEKAQNRLIRFKNEESVTGKKIQARKNKARYNCRYCFKAHSSKELKKRPKVYYTQEATQSGEINLKELR